MPKKNTATIAPAPKSKRATMAALAAAVAKAAPVKPGKRREAPAPSKAPPAKASKAPQKKAPAKKEAEEIDTSGGYDLAGGMHLDIGQAVSVAWPVHGDCPGIVIAHNDPVRVMERPFPRVKANKARIYYPEEGVWADHTADQIQIVKAKKASGKASGKRRAA